MPDRMDWSGLQVFKQNIFIFSPRIRTFFGCLQRWCCTGRFATTIFSAKQHYNIVATLIQMVATLFQHWNGVLRKKSLLRIVPCNITLRVTIVVFYGGFNATATKLWEILILIQANFLENITWSVLGKQNIQAKKVHCLRNRWGAEVSD